MRNTKEVACHECDKKSRCALILAKSGKMVSMVKSGLNVTEPEKFEVWLCWRCLQSAASTVLSADWTIRKLKAEGGG